MFLDKSQKQMKKKMLGRFEFSDKLKDQLVQLVMYKGADPKSLVKKYGLPHVNTLLNWVAIYKKTLEKGVVTLPVMEPTKRSDPKALKKRIKQLEKALEKANVMIYGLNTMIDYAEKELK